jgi:hypothetical protein
VLTAAAGTFGTASSYRIAPVCGKSSSARVIDRTTAATPPAFAASTAPRERWSTAPP